MASKHNSKQVAAVSSVDDATDQHSVGPDRAEQARRRADLFAAHASPLADVGYGLDVPSSTIDKLRKSGLGPRTFKIGRRLYVHQDDLRDWLRQLRDQEGK